MSSEQRYDFSYYEQLVQHDLPDLDLFDLPNLDLFGDSTTTSVIANSPDNLQEHGSVNLQQVGHHFKALDAAEQSQQFKMPYSTAGNNFETDAFAMPQPSASNAFAPLDDPAATFNTAAQSVFGVGNSHSPDDESQSFDNAAGHGHLGGLEAAQTSPLGIHGIPSTSQVTTNNDANAKLRTQSHVPRIEPIDVEPPMTSILELPLDIVRDIHKNWSGPQKCHWQDCVSKATFHSRSSLKAHIRNIHVAPLVCTHPGCSHKKPFGKLCDLKRHIATIHNIAGGYPCLDSDCQAVFPRRDKMMKHAKEKHELFKCPYNHCSATVFAFERKSHVQEFHGRYECATGSCKLGHRSCFTEKNLKRHLRTCHRLTIDQAWHLLSDPSISAQGDEALYAATPLRRTHRDCSSCLTQSGEAQKSPLDAGCH